MSAGFILDLGNGAQMGASIVGSPILSGALVAPASGAVIGQSLSFNNAHGLCNLFAAGVITGSGQLRVQVQCSDSDVSGNYTDPTSGLQTFPGAFTSGGLLWINSGQAGGGILGGFTSGQSVLSGFAVAAGFQRTGEFVRANLLSGDFGGGSLVIGFISQLHTTGSGAGFAYSPTSGTVNV